MNTMKSFAIFKKEDILKLLFESADDKYREFTCKLIPNIDKENTIGVRTPTLRTLAKAIKGSDTAYDFMRALPHRYLEENHLHGYLIEYERDYEKALSLTIDFLPFIDNWATCDTTRPKVFKKDLDTLFTYIRKWIASKHTYTVRYAVGLLLSFYLDEKFDKSHLSLVASIKSDEYYVKMMVAWYFATALSKQYEATIPYLEKGVMEKWTHNKTITKAVESYRISDDKKAYIKTLRKK